MTSQKPGEPGDIVLLTEILALFGSSREPLTVTQVATSLGISMSRASRRLSALNRSGWLKRVENRRKYWLGWRAVQVGMYASAETPIVEASYPHLVALSAELGERVLVSIPANLRAVVVASYSADPENSPQIRSGAQLLFPDSPTTRALYAFRTRKYTALDAEVYDLITTGNSRYAEYADFLAEIEVNRSRGYDFSVDKKNDGLGSLAVPVFSSSGLLAGALTTVMPATRFTENQLSRIVELVRAAAGRIEADLARLERVRRKGKSSVNE